MRRTLLALLAILAIAGDSGAQPAKSGPIRHFVFFNLARARIRDTAFLNERTFAGAQLKYTWAELEPAPDRYALGPIRADVELLRAHGKRLFIQLQDVSFDSSIVNVPRYIREDSSYHGVAAQYDIPNDSEPLARNGGWVARRWDPAVQARFHKLLRELGRAFDGEIEGINLPETSVGFGSSGTLWASGFTPARYREATIENMKALKSAFPRSVVMQYGNFMPGEWLPWNEAGHLRAVYSAAESAGVAMGGPDLLPWQRGHMAHNYPLLRELSRTGVTGIAVQEGNYDVKNPRTGERVTLPEMLSFAREYLGVRYMFWFPQEPYFARDVIPLLRADVRP